MNLTAFDDSRVLNRQAAVRGNFLSVYGQFAVGSGCVHIARRGDFDRTRACDFDRFRYFVGFYRAAVEHIDGEIFADGVNRNVFLGVGNFHIARYAAGNRNAVVCSAYRKVAGIFLSFDCGYTALYIDFIHFSDVHVPRNLRVFSRSKVAVYLADVKAARHTRAFYFDGAGFVCLYIAVEAVDGIRNRTFVDFYCPFVGESFCIDNIFAGSVGYFYVLSLY